MTGQDADGSAWATCGRSLSIGGRSKGSSCRSQRGNIRTRLKTSSRSSTVSSATWVSRHEQVARRRGRTSGQSLVNRRSNPGPNHDRTTRRAPFAQVEGLQRISSEFPAPGRGRPRRCLRSPSAECRTLVRTVLAGNDGDESPESETVHVGEPSGLGFRLSQRHAQNPHA